MSFRITQRDSARVRVLKLLYLTPLVLLAAPLYGLVTGFIDTFQQLRDAVREIRRMRA